MPITKDTSVGKIIDDFIHSKNPKFAGKSKEERRKQALGAYYSMHKENIDDIVTLSVNGNKDEVTQMISNVLLDKVASRLEDFKVDVAQKYFDLKKESVNEWNANPDIGDRVIIHSSGVKGKICGSHGDDHFVVRDDSDNEHRVHKNDVKRG